MVLTAGVVGSLASLSAQPTGGDAGQQLGVDDGSELLGAELDADDELEAVLDTFTIRAGGSGAGLGPVQ